MLEIRKATAGDADEVRVIVDQMTTFLRRFYRPTDAAYAQRSRTQGQRTRLVAVCEATVVGTVEHLVDGDVLRIIGLAVHECHRRRGVARALVEQLATVSAELGCHTMSISTVTATGNVPIFEALGFGVVRICPAEFSVGQTGVPLLEAVLERPTPVATATSTDAAAPSDQLPVDIGAGWPWFARAGIWSGRGVVCVQLHHGPPSPRHAKARRGVRGRCALQQWLAARRRLHPEADCCWGRPVWQHV